MSHLRRVVTAAAVFLTGPTVLADTFGSGENAFEIPFVTIGAPNNVPDTSRERGAAGSVGYTYRIGKYEVPAEAIRKANAASEMAGNPLGITLARPGIPEDEPRSEQPATWMSWFEAARFVNWLNEDKGSLPAYKFDEGGIFELWEQGDPGFDASNHFRNSRARYFLPSFDEWYKAAFYDSSIEDYWDYPTGSNEPPLSVESGAEPGTAVWNQRVGPADVMMAGGESPFGTVGQAGNVYEWQEGPPNGVLTEVPSPDVRAFSSLRWGLTSFNSGLSSEAGNWPRISSIPGAELGLRIASVPEPCSGMLAIAFLASPLFARCRS